MKKIISALVVLSFIFLIPTFVFVEDVVRANMLAIEEGDRTIYNIGTGKGTSINELFQELRQITSYKWEAEHMAARPGEVYKIHLSSDKAFNELGWVPEFSLTEGLEKTIEFFRGVISSTTE